MVAGKLAKLRKGANQHAPIGAPAVSQDAAAELLNVGRRSVQRAREVLDHGAPELVAAVERGEVSVSAAANAARAPKDVQAAAVAAGKDQLRHLAKLAADNESMRADIEETKRKNRARPRSPRPRRPRAGGGC
ncbi:hypothetical protein [Quisquiliibacterium transsilvanicum]|uniref:Uncharacterized protein n=1 Tax=Quisquiliibacterium transsilvanicum TaxID=1549638 RepID=A0A7W8M785_9BURK|nr:hypothetical protein [Quisquiliibacterium transsilvanicum]MBB5270312.1 hypothetical protein [Quisquiliibacterium transsilvanicum]